MDELKNAHTEICYLSEKQNDFENIYLKVREKEGRIYTDDALRQIPFVPQGFPNYQEWKLRQESVQRFVKYIQKNTIAPSILEVGCGNGWLLHYIVQNNPDAVYMGLDMNELELLQALRVFPKENIMWAYGDIFEPIFPAQSFDIIYIASSIQYFKDFDALITQLFYFLSPQGEIHILDSPFYTVSEQAGAQQRTLEYYSQLGFAEMATHYHHHTWESLQHYEYELLYEPSRWKEWLKLNLSPFPWIRIRNSPK